MAGTENINPPTAAAAATLSPRTTTSPPWTQIVRGPEPSEPAVAPASPKAALDQNQPALAPDQNQPALAPENPPESSENGSGNAANSKKPAWSRKPSPPNGGSAVDGGGPVVMGAEQWPALSECTKASPKLTPLDSSKNLPDFGSNSNPQPTLPAQKPSTSNTNHTQGHNHGRPNRQKSMKRDGGGNSQANGGFSHHPLPPGDGSHSHNSLVKPNSGSGSESSGRENPQSHSNREPGQRNATGDHPQPRNSFRRGNGGPHSRGDGFHQNYGGRRGDQDRGNNDWNHQRSFNGRDAPMQPRGGPRGFVRPPPVSAPFVHPVGPAPMRPFISPMGMPDMHMLYFPHGVPFVAPVPAPMYFPAPDPQLHAKIVNQIEYYFSNENLVKDTFLRKNMDKEGWVSISLIASFKKVMQLTENIQLILDSVRSSSIVEVQGDKVRKRDEWMKWIMPPTVHFPTTAESQSPRSPDIAALSAQTQSFSLNERTNDTVSMLRSSSGDLSRSAPAAKDVACSSGC